MPGGWDPQGPLNRPSVLLKAGGVGKGPAAATGLEGLHVKEKRRKKTTLQ